MIEKIISSISPKWAFERKQYAEALRAYEAATPGRLRDSLKQSSIGDADYVNQLAGMSLTRQARFMEENYDIASGILDTLTDRIVGPGLVYTPMVRSPDGELATAFNTELRDVLRDMSDSIDVTGELSEGMLDNVGCRAWLRDGEYFERLLTGNIAGNSNDVPFKVQFLESDYCPLSLSDSKKNIVQGVEKDAWGKPSAYHFYASNPNTSSVSPGFSILTSGISTGTRRVPASFVSHVKLVKRWPQTRGVTILHSVISRLLETKEYDDSERVAARVAAAMMFQVRRGANADGKSRVSNAEKQLDVMPGQFFEHLGRDEWIEMITSNRPNANLESYRDSQLRAASAGTRLGFSDVGKKPVGTYATQRYELTTNWLSIRVLRSAFVRMAVLKRHRAKVDMALMSGVMRPPRAGEVDMRTLYRFDARGPAMPQLDPLKEIKAALEAIRGGMSTRSAYIRERGEDPAEVFDTLFDELNMASARGYTVSDSGYFVEDDVSDEK